MCVVSMVGDYYRDKWQDQWPVQYPYAPNSPTVTLIEFEVLRKEVKEMKELLKRAKAYDEANNEPDCEVEDKMEKLRKVAELVGIDLDDVLGART